MHSKQKILFIFNSTEAFATSRLSLLRAAIAIGYQVEAAMPDVESIFPEKYSDIIFHELYINRKSTNLLCQLKTLCSLKKIFQKSRPDLIQCYRVKLSLYGALVAKFLKVPAIVCVFTGLGYLFMSNNIKAKILKPIVKLSFKYALKHPNIRVVFQNRDDQREFVSSKIINQENTALIAGSGINLKNFFYTPEPNLIVPEVLLLSRMLWDKGIKEYVRAARIVKKSGVIVKFLLIGDTDEQGLTGISAIQLKKWHEEGIVEWRMGLSPDKIPALLAGVNIICLPSYREGLPRVLIEGAACGRALVTTDVPGCREVVKNQYNGLLVPVKNSEKLAEALITLIQNPQQRQQMGVNGCLMAEQEFSIEKVIKANLAIYRELLASL